MTHRNAAGVRPNEAGLARDCTKFRVCRRRHLSHEFDSYTSGIANPHSDCQFRFNICERTTARQDLELLCVHPGDRVRQQAGQFGN